MIHPGQIIPDMRRSTRNGHATKNHDLSPTSSPQCGKFVDPRPFPPFRPSISALPLKGLARRGLLDMQLGALPRTDPVLWMNSAGVGMFLSFFSITSSWCHVFLLNSCCFSWKTKRLFKVASQNLQRSFQRSISWNQTLSPPLWRESPKAAKLPKCCPPAWSHPLAYREAPPLGVGHFQPSKYWEFTQQVRDWTNKNEIRQEPVGTWRSQDGTNKTWDLNKAHGTHGNITGNNYRSIYRIVVFLGELKEQLMFSLLTYNMLGLLGCLGIPYFQPKTVEIWATVWFLWFLNCFTGNSTFQNPR